MWLSLPSNMHRLFDSRHLFRQDTEEDLRKNYRVGYLAQNQGFALRSPATAVSELAARVDFTPSRNLRRKGAELECRLPAKIGVGAPTYLG
jgi:hypothetical protein